MFDMIKAEASKQLKLATQEVAEFRERIAEEMLDDGVRKAREHQLEHPDGFSTPLQEAIDRAQTKAAKLRRAADEIAPKFATALLAWDAAEAGLERLRQAQKTKHDMADKRGLSGMYASAEEFVAALHQEGVCHWHLKQLNTLEIAILADLILWKADDARHRSATSPWRAVISEYGDRILCKASGPARVSEPGNAPPKPELRESWKTWPYHDTKKMRADLSDNAACVQTADSTDRAGSSVAIIERDSDDGKGGGGTSSRQAHTRVNERETPIPYEAVQAHRQTQPILAPRGAEPRLSMREAIARKHNAHQQRSKDDEQ